MPIWQMLGGNDPKVPAYASTVTWDTMDEYERYIKHCIDVGFTAFKLHAWGDAKEDAKLSRNLRKWTGPDADLMFDGSAGWDYVTSMWFGRVLEECGFLWYEEPMREFELGSYRKLCDALDIPVLAAETSGRLPLEHGDLDPDGRARHDARQLELQGRHHRRDEDRASVGQPRHALPGARHGPAERAALRRHPHQRLLRAARHRQRADRRARRSSASSRSTTAILDVSSEPGLGDDIDWAQVERTARGERLAHGRRAEPLAATGARRSAGFGPRLADLSDSRYWAYYLLLPSLLLICAVVLYPTVWGIGLSFREMRLNRLDLGTGFVGLKHYQALIDDPVFWLSLRNTVVWVDRRGGRRARARALPRRCCSTATCRASGSSRVLVLLPWFLPNVVAGHMWALMLDPRLGVINDILVKIGVLVDLQGLVRRSRHGAGGRPGGRDLARLPVLRAAAAGRAEGDPAGALRGGRHRRRRRLRSSSATSRCRSSSMIMVAAVVLRVISLVNSPDILLILTGGGPGRSTLVLSLYAFQKANQRIQLRLRQRASRS